MSDLAGQLNFGKIEKVKIELDLDEKYKNEATEIEKNHYTTNKNNLSVYVPDRYFSTKTLNIQTFDIKKFSGINFTENIDSIIEYIGSTVSDDIDGIKFKSGNDQYTLTTFHNDKKYKAKKIGSGGFGEVSMTGEILGLSGKEEFKRSFAIKKISKTSKDAFREIAYNIFKTNKQLSHNDNLLNPKSSYLGSISSKSENACYIFMDKIGQNSIICTRHFRNRQF